MDIPNVCPHCGGTEHLDWSLATRLANGAPMDGRLRKNEVVPQLFLACEECGEVLLTVETDEELAEVIHRPPIQIVIRRPARADA